MNAPTEAHVQQKARAFVAGVDSSNIRNDLSAYLQAAGASLKKKVLSAGESGFTITKLDGKHVITVNSQETTERQRFTICHEIAHIMLELPSSHVQVPSWSFAKRDPNEVLCDAFAAELLMPYKLFKAAMPAEEPSLSVIERLASDFNTSFPAAASRYATLASFPCAFVTMERDSIRYAARSTALRAANAWITPRAQIPRGSVAHRLRAAGLSTFETDFVEQDLWFATWEKGLELSELSRHYAHSDTTVSLIWFQDEALPEVERDRFGTRVVEDAGLDELTGELPWPGKKKRK